MNDMLVIPRYIFMKLFHEYCEDRDCGYCYFRGEDLPEYFYQEPHTYCKIGRLLDNQEKAVLILKEKTKMKGE